MHICTQMCMHAYMHSACGCKLCYCMYDICVCCVVTLVCARVCVCVSVCVCMCVCTQLECNATSPFLKNAHAFANACACACTCACVCVTVCACVYLCVYVCILNKGTRSCTTFSCVHICSREGVCVRV